MKFDGNAVMGMVRTSPLMGLVLAVSLLTAGCRSDGSTPHQPVPGPAHTLVFIDQSASAKTSADTRALFADSLEHLVRARMENSGDRITLFPVHKRTTSKVGRVDKVNRVPLPAEKEFEVDQSQEEIRYRIETMRFVDTTAKDLRAAYNAMAVDREFGRWTDLWGTIGVASEEFASDGSRKKIYYFSDMFESMSGEGRRNFDRRPPTSRQEAEQWAVEDVQALANFVPVRREVLSQVEVRVLQGRLATKENAQYVKFYWRRFFEELGVKDVHYN